MNMYKNKNNKNDNKSYGQLLLLAATCAAKSANLAV